MSWWSNRPKDEATYFLLSARPECALQSAGPPASMSRPHSQGYVSIARSLAVSPPVNRTLADVWVRQIRKLGEGQREFSPPCVRRNESRAGVSVQLTDTSGSVPSGKAQHQASGTDKVYHIDGIVMAIMLALFVAAIDNTLLMNSLVVPSQYTPCRVHCTSIISQQTFLCAYRKGHAMCRFKTVAHVSNGSSSNPVFCSSIRKAAQ